MLGKRKPSRPFVRDPANDESLSRKVAQNDRDGPMPSLWKARRYLSRGESFGNRYPGGYLRAPSDERMEDVALRQCGPKRYSPARTAASITRRASTRKVVPLR